MNDSDTGVAGFLVSVMIVTFVALFVFHHLLPEKRSRCQATAEVRGYAVGWLDGRLQCNVTLDHGRTWVIIRDWDKPR